MVMVVDMVVVLVVGNGSDGSSLNIATSMVITKLRLPLETVGFISHRS